MCSLAWHLNNDQIVLSASHTTAQSALMSLGSANLLRMWKCIKIASTADIDLVVQDTEAKLKAGNMSVSSLSGDLKKQERQTILAKFQRGDFRALIVSGVHANWPWQHAVLHD